MKYILILLFSFSQVFAQNKVTIGGGGSFSGGGAETDPVVKAINGLVKSNGTTIATATAGTDYLTPSGSAASLTSFPSSLATLTGTQTLTNKRITWRSGSITSSATPTPDADSQDQFNITALATNANIAAPTGTPTNGQTLLIRITSDGSVRTLTWNAIYRAGTDFGLPSATVATKTLYVQYIWNPLASKWDCTGLTRDF